MSEQISLFETSDVNRIVDLIEKALPDYLKKSGKIYIKPNSETTPYSSIMFSPLQGTSCYRTKEIPDGLICRVKTTGKIKYVSFSVQFEKNLTDNGLNISKTQSEDFWRIELSEFYSFASSRNEAFCKLVSAVIVSLFTFDRFDCCGKFKECSDAGRCLHDDMLYSTACTYRKKLESGIVFYGKNKTLLPSVSTIQTETPIKKGTKTIVKEAESVYSAKRQMPTIKDTVPPKSDWKRFESKHEKLKKYKEWRFISDKATYIKTLIYSGFYTDIPTTCDVVGYTDYDEVIIKLGDKLHTINPVYLLQMQSFDTPSKLPSKTIPTEYIVLDLETTGFGADIQKVIEIAAVKIENGEITDRFETLINPEMHISSRITKINHISDEDVKNAPVIQSAIADFIEFIDDLPLVAHNGNAFDFKFIKKEAEAIGRKLANPTFDTLMLARLAFPEAENHQLTTLVEYLQIEAKNTHRAMPDVLATVALFQKCYNEFMPKIKYSIIDE